MEDFFRDRALLRWDGMHLVLALTAIEAKIHEGLHSVEAVSDVVIGGRADVLEIGATIHWKGMSSRIQIELKEFRLRARRLGLRLGRIRLLRGVRVPRSLVEKLLTKYGRGKVRVFQGRGIVVVDLRKQLPPELELRLLSLQVTGRELHLWLGPGSLMDLPRHGKESGKLPAESPPRLQSRHRDAGSEKIDGQQRG